MEYRIKYTSYMGKKTFNEIKEFKAENDEEAKRYFYQFKEEYEKATTFTRYLVQGLERIDQREITTKIV